jgi:4-amino-4-deoxy-L-arabinose transferase-like glycosyltransferase
MNIVINRIFKKEVVLVFILFIISACLRFYKLGGIPNGLNQDESSIGYNAYSILKTGKDEYGIRFPLYFRSLGDYKLPVYVYLTAGSVKIFGLTPFAVRFPSALLGTFSVPILYLLVRQLSKDKSIAFLTSVLLMINPWHLHFSRAAFEVNASLFFALTGFYFFIKSLENNKKLIYFILSGLNFCLSLYSYNLSRLLAPLLFFSLIIIYRKKIRRFKRVELILSGVFFSVILAPFILSFLSPSGLSSARGALLISTDVTSRAVEFRSYVLSLPGILLKLLFNKWILLSWYYIENLVNSLSTIFLFTSGSTHGNQGIGNIGMFYIFQLPMAVYGLVEIINLKKRLLYPFIIWAVVVLAVLGLSKEVPHATRGFFFVIPVQIFSAVGILEFYRYISGLRKTLKTAIVVISAFLIFLNILYYFTSYYFRFPIFFAKQWRYDDMKLSLYLKENAWKYNSIVIDENSGFNYPSLLFFVSYDPDQFQKSAVREYDKEGFTRVKSFGKFIFKKIDWREDYKEDHFLLIANTENKPSQIIPKDIIYLPERPVVIPDGEKLINLTSKEIGYEIVESLERQKIN